MVDLIIEKYCSQFTIYEIRNGKKEKSWWCGYYAS